MIQPDKEPTGDQASVSLQLDVKAVHSPGQVCVI
jgi:hypothetical protein